MGRRGPKPGEWGRPPVSLRQRFWTKVNKKGPIHPVLKTRCWLWMGDVNSAGYGRVRGESVDGSPKLLAHKAGYLLQVGLIPDGKCVLHRCDTRLCVRQSHLWIGSRKENSQDMMRKGRGRGQFKRSKDRTS